MREIALESQQQHLVTDVEEVSAAGADLIGDQRPVNRALVDAHVGRHHWPRRLKAGIRLSQGQVFVEDVHELPEVSFLPVAPWSLALLDDRVDGSLRGASISHCHELPPTEL